MDNNKESITKFNIEMHLVLYSLYETITVFLIIILEYSLSKSILIPQTLLYL